MTLFNKNAGLKKKNCMFMLFCNICVFIIINDKTLQLLLFYLVTDDTMPKNVKEGRAPTSTLP